MLEKIAYHKVATSAEEGYGDERKSFDSIALPPSKIDPRIHSTTALLTLSLLTSIVSLILHFYPIGGPFMESLCHGRFSAYSELSMSTMWTLALSWKFIRSTLEARPAAMGPI